MIFSLQLRTSVGQANATKECILHLMETPSKQVEIPFSKKLERMLLHKIDEDPSKVFCYLKQSTACERECIK